MVKTQECCWWITKYTPLKAKYFTTEMLLRNSVLAAASYLGCVCKMYIKENCSEKVHFPLLKGQMEKKSPKLTDAVLQRYLILTAFVSPRHIKITSAEQEFNFALCCFILNMFAVWKKCQTKNHRIEIRQSTTLTSCLQHNKNLYFMTVFLESQMICIRYQIPQNSCWRMKILMVRRYQHGLTHLAKVHRALTLPSPPTSGMGEGTEEKIVKFVGWDRQF